jgi:hypothetical protein
VSAQHLDELRAQAAYARQRYRLYKARAYALAPTSALRMRELERAADGADSRLRAAQAQERRPPQSP